MSIQTFESQIWPELLCQADPKYVPRPSDLFAVVIAKKLSKEETEMASTEDFQENSSTRNGDNSSYVATTI